MSVQLAMYKGRGSLGNAFVRWWTKSIYSHCELVVDGACYSSSVMDKGVRRKPVGTGNDEIDLLSGNWDFFDLPWANHDLVVEYFIATDHYRYGWPSLLFSQFFNLNKRTSESQFCSEWCASALGLPAASSLSPETLSQWCKYLCK